MVGACIADPGAGVRGHPPPETTDRGDAASGVDVRRHRRPAAPSPAGGGPRLADRAAERTPAPDAGSATDAGLGDRPGTIETTGRRRTPPRCGIDRSGRACTAAARYLGEG